MRQIHDCGQCGVANNTNKANKPNNKNKPPGGNNGLTRSALEVI